MLEANRCKSAISERMAFLGRAQYQFVFKFFPNAIRHFQFILSKIRKKPDLLGRVFLWQGVIGINCYEKDFFLIFELVYVFRLVFDFDAKPGSGSPGFFMPVLLFLGK